MNVGSWTLLLLCVLHLHFGHTQLTTELTLTNMDVMATNQLTVKGIPNLDAKRFYTEIGYGEKNIGIHFDVRFDYGEDHHIIVLNSLKDGIWSTEQKEKGDFLFNQGEEFKIIINFNEDKFLVSMPGNNILSFPNRFGADKFTFIRVWGDLRIKSFIID